MYFFGGFGINFLFNMIFLIQYSGKLESESFNGRPADYIFMLLFGGTVMTIAAYFLQLPLISFALLMMLIWVWCRRNATASVSLFYFSFKAIYFPLVLIAIHVLMGGSPVMDLVGVVAGHLYHFLVDIVPITYGLNVLRTPQFMYSIFPNVGIQNQVRGAGFHAMAPDPRNFPRNGGGGPNQPQQQQQPPPQRQVRGHSWGQGRVLGHDQQNN